MRGSAARATPLPYLPQLHDAALLAQARENPQQVFGHDPARVWRAISSALAEIRYGPDASDDTRALLAQTWSNPWANNAQPITVNDVAPPRSQLRK